MAFGRTLILLPAEKQDFENSDDDATKRIGRVTGIRYGETTNEPEEVEVRAGLFGRTKLLISVHDITEIDPEHRRLALADPPRPLSE
jgi:hypothetical protein